MFASATILICIINKHGLFRPQHIGSISCTPFSGDLCTCVLLFYRVVVYGCGMWYCSGFGSRAGKLPEHVVVIVVGRKRRTAVLYSFPISPSPLQTSPKCVPRTRTHSHTTTYTLTHKQTCVRSSTSVLALGLSVNRCVFKNYYFIFQIFLISYS